MIQVPILLPDDHHDDDERPVYDRGLVYDLTTLDRRRMLQLLGFGGISAGMFVIVGCTPDSGATSSAGAASGSTAGANTADGASCANIPEETAGPFPGDGSNGPDILAQSGVVRSDIRSSFGSSSMVAEGVPLTINLVIEDGTDCAPIDGAAVYLWHCDRGGDYSMYTGTAADENYLRGVQAAGADGTVSFTSIFPACYSGRWPHIHFEVYPSLELATDEANKIATSQIALPEDICNEVYATDGYEQSVRNLSQVTLQSDNVFGNDGGVQQLGTIEGSVSDGLTVTLVVPVNA